MPIVKTKQNQYDYRDVESFEELYQKHVDAMTTEGLHSKAAIAAELAWRDRQIDELNDEISKLRYTIARLTQRED